MGRGLLVDSLLPNASVPVRFLEDILRAFPVELHPFMNVSNSLTDPSKDVMRLWSCGTSATLAAR